MLIINIKEFLCPAIICYGCLCFQVRIASHPDYQGMGYGTRALTLLEDYYSGKIQDLSESVADKNSAEINTVEELDEVKQEYCAGTTYMFVQFPAVPVHVFLYIFSKNNSSNNNN